MIQGRTLIIDLHDLLHVDTQRRALRKRIADLANNIGKPAFKIDPEGCLIVVPGTGVRWIRNSTLLGRLFGGRIETRPRHQSRLNFQFEPLALPDRTPLPTKSGHRLIRIWNSEY